jgi:hypothetical protein
MAIVGGCGSGQVGANQCRRETWDGLQLGTFVKGKQELAANREQISWGT